MNWKDIREIVIRRIFVRITDFKLKYACFSSRNPVELEY
jgi:hypothetical protein